MVKGVYADRGSRKPKINSLGFTFCQQPSPEEQEYELHSVDGVIQLSV